MKSGTVPILVTAGTVIFKLQTKAMSAVQTVRKPVQLSSAVIFTYLLGFPLFARRDSKWLQGWGNVALLCRQPWNDMSMTIRTMRHWPLDIPDLPQLRMVSCRIENLTRRTHINTARTKAHRLQKDAKVRSVITQTVVVNRIALAGEHFSLVATEQHRVDLRWSYI